MTNPVTGSYAHNLVPLHRDPAIDVAGGDLVYKRPIHDYTSQDGTSGHFDARRRLTEFRAGEWLTTLKQVYPRGGVYSHRWKTPAGGVQNHEAATSMTSGKQVLFSRSHNQMRFSFSNPGQGDLMVLSGVHLVTTPEAVRSFFQVSPSSEAFNDMAEVLLELASEAFGLPRNFFKYDIDQKSRSVTLAQAANVNSAWLYATPHPHVPDVFRVDVFGERGLRIGSQTAALLDYLHHHPRELERLLAETQRPVSWGDWVRVGGRSMGRVMSQLPHIQADLARQVANRIK